MSARRISAWFGRRSSRQILLVSWLATLVYAYPGIVTVDSLDHLREGRDHFYTDGHPPAMAALFGFLDRIITGPFGMLLLQTGALLLGMYYVLRHAMSERRAAIVAALVLVFPPVLAPMAVIWKDCVMAGFFMLGLAGLLADCKWRRLAGLAALVVATAVRYNALAATLPMIVLLFYWFDATSWKQRVARYALAFAAWLAVTGLAFAINAHLTDQKMYVWQSSNAVLDIAGTLSRLDGTIPDDELRREFAGTDMRVDKDIHAELRRRYHTTDFEPLILGDDRLWDLPLAGREPAPEARRDAITRVFWDVVTAHPGAYLRHRWAVFAEVIALGHDPASPVITHRSEPTSFVEWMKLGTTHSQLQLRLQNGARWVAKHTPLFVPWVYLVIALILLPICLRQRDVLAILLSGLGLEASLFLLAPTADYRYSHWLVICTVVGVAMLIARRATRRA